MRRWNGWGDDAVAMDLPAAAAALLATLVGPGQRLPDASLAQVLASVPPSRLPQHALVSVQAEDRVRHARGQSLPDWLAMRSGEFDVFPDGVAFPETAAQIRELLDWATAHDVVLIPYGGGTSVVGHITPQTGARAVLTLSLERMNQLVEIDADSLLATFGPGANGPQVESQLRVQGFTLGHFPQSWELSTLGGWVAARSSGQQSLRYGRIEQLFAGGTLETFSGPMAIPTFPASAAGPDLRELVLGSEGRFGIISAVKVRISRLAAEESFYAVFLPDWERALTAVRELVQARIPLSMLRLSNAVETQTQLTLAGQSRSVAWLEKYLAWRGADGGKCMLTFGVTGNRQQNATSLRQVRLRLRHSGGVFTGTLLGRKWAEHRFRFPYLRDSLWSAGYAVDTLETATDWSNVDALLQQVEASLRTALTATGERVHVFTHLSHAYGEGCSLYTTYVFRPGTSYAQAHARWQQLKQAASRAIVDHGGTISHQHGVGRDHAAYLPAEKGELGMATLRALSMHFDPEQRLVPGVLLEMP